MLKVDKSSKMLIALPSLLDPNFRHSVILMVDSTSEGSMGLVINRPSDISISSLLPDPQNQEVPEDIPAWVGGPVGVDNGLILHHEKENAEDQILITSSETALKNLVKSSQVKKNASQPLYPYRFLYGYAGWGPHQLEDELRLGVWTETNINTDILFNCPWQEMWERSLLSLGIKPSDLVGQPQEYLN